MSKTIDDFRNFFRTDKEKHAFSLREAIQETLSLHEAQFRSHDIRVSILGEDRTLFSFKSEFQQAMLNLINNAKDALIEHYSEEKTIVIELLDNEIVVEDNGGGIPLEIMERIFEPYFTTKEQGKGTGIGLYMSKLIIEKNMGGKLSVTNTKDGARFSMRF